MTLFPEDPEFEIGKAGFGDKDPSGQPLDVLNRKPLGQKLTDLVDRIDQPLVIALDGGWGSGKSHFLKLWTGAHSKELGGKAEVIYFDAFEHDYLDDPLVSLVSRLVVLGKAKAWPTKALDKVKRSAMPLLRGVLRTGLALATAGISETTGPVLDAVVGKVDDMTDDQIDGFWQKETGRIAAMGQFKKALQALTLPKTDADAARKIVFIVDELDRCRPDYALSLLEIIKHFFAVPNVHFVLGVNLDALENSVKARYGHGIDAAQYLQKFVGLKMSLPLKPALNTGPRNEIAFLNYFTAQHKISVGLRSQIQPYLRTFVERRTISLRDFQHLIACLQLFPDDVEYHFDAKRQLCFLALFVKVMSPNLYLKFLDGTAAFGHVCSFLGFPTNLTDGLQEHDQRMWMFCAYFFSEELTKEVRAFAEKEMGPHWLKGAKKREWIRDIVQENLETFQLPLPS